MKTKLGAVNIVNNTLCMMDLNRIDHCEDINNANSGYGIIEFTEDNLFFADLENQLYSVYGIPSKERFQEWDELIVELSDETAFSSKKVGNLYVDSGSLIICDSNLIGNWTDESIDGLANVICWGTHAPKIANKLNLKKKGDVYGWFDVPLEKTHEYLKKLERKKKFWHGLLYLSEPHSPKNMLKYSLEESKSKSSNMNIGATKVFCIWLHQDGTWPVYIDFSSNDIPFSIRISLK